MPVDNSHNYKQLEALVDSYVMTQGVVGDSMANHIANKAQEFIHDPSNREVMKGPLGKELIQKQTRLVNYLTIKNKFEECVKNKTSQRQLDQRVLSAARSARDIKLECNQELFKFKSIDDLSKNIFETLGTKTYEEILQENETIGNGKFENMYDQREVIKNKRNFQDQLFAQSMENAIATYIDHKYKYEKDFLKDGTSSNEKSYLVNNFCKKENCDTKTRKFINETIDKKIKEIISKKPKRYTPESATQEINESIERLNQKLEVAGQSIKTEGGYIKLGFWDSSDASFDSNAKSSFNDYVQTYLSEASSGPSTLLFTDILKERSGGLRQMEDDALNEETVYLGDTKYSFKKHKKVTPADITKAKNEVNNKIIEQTEKLLEMNKNKVAQEKEWLTKNKAKEDTLFGNDADDIEEKRNSDLRKLMKSNPAAVGQLLIKNPALSKVACEVINDIEDEDESDEAWDKAFMWGGMIVGGALLLTGVGAAAGATLIAGTVTAGTLAAVSTAAFASGTALGLVEGGYWSKRTHDHYQAMNEYDRAFLAGSGDTQNIVDVRQTLSKYKEARFDALLSLGFSAVDLGAMKSVGKIGSVTSKGLNKTLTPKQMDAVTYFYKRISSDSALMGKLVRASKEMGESAGAKIDDFIQSLALVGEKSKNMILDYLSNSSLTPNKIKNIIDDAIEAGKSCTKR
jgi:hypothetical protein